MQTAVHLFNERGYHATSLDDIAEALSVTKPTIYNYFPSKDELMFACVQQGVASVREAIRATRSLDLSGRDRLRAVMCDYAIITTRDFGKCIALIDDRVLSEGSRGHFRALKRGISDDIQAVVEEALADGSLPPGNAQIITFTFTGALNWICRWFDPSGPMTAEEVAAASVDTLLPRSG